MTEAKKTVEVSLSQNEYDYLAELADRMDREVGSQIRYWVRKKIRKYRHKDEMRRMREGRS